jgi:hypothetical protein
MNIRKIIREEILIESLEDRLKGAFNKWCTKTWMGNEVWVSGVRDEYDYEYEQDYEFKSSDDYLKYELSRKCGDETTLKEWMTYRKQMDKPDIFQYKSWREFHNDLLKAKDKSFTKQLKTTKEGEDYEKIYEDGDMIIIVPLTHVGSCKYGQGTRWCTTMKTAPQYFESYNKSGVLYRVLQKNDNYKKLFNDIFRNIDNADKVSINIKRDSDSYTMVDKVDNYYKESATKDFMTKLPSEALKSILTYHKNNK